MGADTMPTERSHPAVFLQDFVDVGRPLDDVAGRIADGVGWLQPLASAAGGDGWSLLVRIGPSNAGEGPSWEVVLRLGPTAARGDAVVVPLRWEAARHRTLVPILEGDLEVAPLGDDRCRLVLHASYRPPLEGLGRWLDRALLHRVAESTVRSFLERVADALEEGVDASST